MEAISKKKKHKKWNPNPWAVCHTTVDKSKDPEKYERCVMDVKKKQNKKSFNLKQYRVAYVNDMQHAKSIIHDMLHKDIEITLDFAERAMVSNNLDPNLALDAIQYWEYVGMLKKPDASIPKWVLAT
ncbi:MAG: hypothetical protein WC375_03610 [Methanomassiliicoccales archaeon]